MALLLQWTQGMHCTNRNDSRVTRIRRTPRATLVLAPLPAPSRAIVAPAAGSPGEVLLSDALASHLEIAINRIDVLTDCVDLLAQQLAGAIDRVELLESIFRSADAEAVPTHGPASESDPERAATSQAPEVPRAIDDSVRPTFALLRDAALHTVASSQHRTAAR